MVGGRPDARREEGILHQCHTSCASFVLLVGTHRTRQG